MVNHPFLLHPCFLSTSMTYVIIFIEACFCHGIKKGNCNKTLGTLFCVKLYFDNPL